VFEVLRVQHGEILKRGAFSKPLMVGKRGKRFFMLMKRQELGSL
jgi:hypothetical protein